MAITAEKLIPTPKKSSVTKGTKFRVKTISIKVNKINEILKGTLAVEKKQRDQERKSEERTTSSKAEDALEKEQKKNSKFKLPAPLKGLNPIDKIKNFLFNVLAGYIAVRLIDKLPMLEKLIPKIAAAISFIEDWGGKILDGLVTFIDKGYEMYDGLRTKVGDLFGEDGKKKFDEISGVLTKVLNGVLIAGMLGLRSSLSNPFKSGKPGIKPPSGVPRGTKPGAVRRYTQRFGRKAAVKRFGKDAVTRLGGSASRSAATKLARRGAVGILGKGGTKVGLRFLKNIISPIVKRIPIIGGLIDFALNFFVFKEPIGRAAFAAIGATIFGALGATAGTVIPFAGNIVGGILGSLVGDIAGKWLYDTFFSRKKPVELDSEIGTSKGDRERRSSTEQSRPRAPANISGVQGAPLGMGEKQAFATVYELAKNHDAKFPEIVAAQAMHETGYLSDSLASVFNSTGRTNAFGQTGDRGYGTISRKGSSTGWTVYPSLDEAVKDNIKLWHRTANHPGNYEAFDRPIDGIASVAPVYSPNADPANIRLGYTVDAYSRGMVKIMKSMGFDPYKRNARVDLSKEANLRNVTPITSPTSTISSPTSTTSAQIPGQINSGTGGAYVRSAGGTKLAGDLGRHIQSELVSAAQSGQGYMGGDYSKVSEHPDFGGSFKRSYRSWHNVDRGIDIGGFWPKDQKKIIAKVLEFNRKNNAQPVEFLYGKPGTPNSGTHGDHVHVAYKKGGVTLGEPHMATLGEEGPELVIDANSMGPAKDMLLAINQASTYDGVMKAIREYAPYDAMAPETIMIPPPPQGQYGGGQGKTMAVPIVLSGSDSSSTFDVLYQGA
jgi:ABC-type antimicrobial peptide transport system permease subunit